MRFDLSHGCGCADSISWPYQLYRQDKITAPTDELARAWGMPQQCVTLEQFGGGLGDIAGDLAAWRTAFSYIALLTGAGYVQLEAKDYYVPATVYPPAACGVVGAGRADFQPPSGGPARTGTRVIVTQEGGLFEGAIWTDVYEDRSQNPTNYMPGFVPLGNAFWFSNLTISTPDDTNRVDCGVFIACMKYWRFDNVIFEGPFADMPARPDATWSDRNTYLINLHPDINIQPSTGLNTWSFWNCGFQGVRCAGVVGTTRDPATYAAADWLWAWGGTSDGAYYSPWLRPAGLTGELEDHGACWVFDAAIKNAAGAGQGIRVYGSEDRANVAKYMYRFGRINRVEFYSGYGEATAGHTALVEWSTTNTGIVDFDGGRRILTHLCVDGVEKSYGLEGYVGQVPGLNYVDYQGNGARNGVVYSAGGISPVMADPDAPVPTGAVGSSSRVWAVGWFDLLRAATGFLKLRGPSGAQLLVGSSVMLEAATGGVTVSGPILPNANGTLSLGTSLLNFVQIGAARVRYYFGRLELRGSDGLDLFSGNATAKVSIETTGVVNVTTGAIQRAGTQVVDTRKTGWSTPTGTRSRATFDPATVTTAELGQRVAALLDDMNSATSGHGLIGP